MLALIHRLFANYLRRHTVASLRKEKSRKLSAGIFARLGDVFPIDVVVKDDATSDELIHREGMGGILL